MRFIKIIISAFIFGILTILTQVGGVVYLLTYFTRRWTDRWTTNYFLKITFRWGSFILLYSLVTFLIVPVLARPLGRVPLPVFETSNIRPLNMMTCILNRHYVRPELEEVVFQTAETMQAKFPGIVLNYLDANFPFINGFPLIPHLSHNDGKKLDLSFIYTEAKTALPTNEVPSAIGYGVCEGPLPGEPHTAGFCKERGYWQYSLLENVVSQARKKDFVFDPIRTDELVTCIAFNPSVGKIFIEPHLKARMNLTSDKIRFHGCRAVRHDDHLHIQLQ